MDSANNPADDITREKTLLELAGKTRWRQGPAFLLQPPEVWPKQSATEETENSGELRKPTVCCFATSILTSLLPNADQFSSFSALIEAVAQSSSGSSVSPVSLSADDYQEAESSTETSQQDSFPEEFNLLRNGKLVAATSRLLTLTPEYDETVKLIRVGGRLRGNDQLEPDSIHPVVMDQRHKVTQLLSFRRAAAKILILHGREFGFHSDGPLPLHRTKG